MPRFAPTPVFLVSLVLFSVLLFAGGQAAKAQESEALSWIEFSLGDRPVRVSSGGVLTIHPDAAFRIVRVRTTAWLDGLLGSLLDRGVKAELAGRPDVDLHKFHTLSEIFGEEAYKRKDLAVRVVKDGLALGKVTLSVRVLPIDWLRRAEAAESIREKIEYTKNALELTPDDRLLMLRLVDLLTEAKRLKEAAELLEGYAESSGDVRLLNRLAALYQELGQDGKAAGVLSQLLAERPRDPELLGRLAGIYTKLERWQEASLMLERLSELQAKGRRARTLVDLADALAKSGAQDRAAQAMDQALKLRPGDAELWRRAAELKSRTGDKAQALSALAKAAQLDPGNSKLQMQYAEALLKAGEKSRAAAEMEKLALKDPGNAALWSRLARLYEEIKDKDGIARAYGRLGRLKPNDADLQYNLAVMAMDRGDFAEALVHLDAACRLRPKDREIARARLDSLIKLGKWEAAEKQALAIVDGLESHKALVNELYEVLSGKRPELLKKILAQALRKNPKQSSIYEMQADAALAAGDEKAAVAALSAGVKALPDDTKLWFLLSKVYEAMGEEAKAIEVLEKVLDRDPDYPGVEERYLQLKTRDLKENTESKNKGGKKP